MPGKIQLTPRDLGVARSSLSWILTAPGGAVWLPLVLYAVGMTAPGDLIATFARTLPFDPDPFQREAMLALARGESVLVTAPTGAGKTLVADFAAFRAMATGRKLIYTTPIKEGALQPEVSTVQAWPCPDCACRWRAPSLPSTTDGRSRPPRSCAA